MFIVGAKGTERNNENPVVVQAYGGFNESKLPCFDPSIIPFLESGGVYVLVNARVAGSSAKTGTGPEFAPTSRTRSTI